ncbi:MAG: GNAT family N-acetyltransferase [Phycisphaerae bacterium]|nr:GNAT family N-acetyltransferase [Phycisphaerae bacterium]
MSNADACITPLPRPVSDADFGGLACLLVDAVESGAAVSFVLPLTRETAMTWWRSALSPESQSRVLVARDPAGGIIGSVQLCPAWAPNQPHRAELCKLLVHHSARGRGLGARLVLAAEEAARAAGFTLLTLDAKRGGAAERLYRRLGWVHAGTIPDFALDPDGRALHDAVIFYKNVAASAGP